MTPPRYVMREMYGVTVGANQATWQFLILDSWECYREVLQRHSSNDHEPHVLRRQVRVYLDALNEPRLCKCGCGEELPLLFPLHRGERRLFMSAKHRAKARWQAA